MSHVNISAKAEYPEPKLVKNVIEILLSFLWRLVLNKVKVEF